MKGFFEGKGKILYMPDCQDCLLLFIWRTWLAPCYSFVNLSGMKARTRNLILRWDKFPLYQSLAERLINESFSVFMSLYYKYITFKLNFVMANWLKMTDYKNGRLTPTYVAILTTLVITRKVLVFSEVQDFTLWLLLVLPPSYLHKCIHLQFGVVLCFGIDSAFQQGDKAWKGTFVSRWIAAWHTALWILYYLGRL